MRQIRHLLKKKTAAGLFPVFALGVFLGSPVRTVQAEEMPYIASVAQLKADAAGQKLTVKVNELSFEKTMADFGEVLLVVQDQADGTRICHIPDLHAADVLADEIDQALLSMPAGDAFYYFDEDTGTFQTCPGAFIRQINDAGRQKICQGLLEATADKNGTDKKIILEEKDFDKVYADIPEKVLANRYTLKGSCTTSLKGSSSNRISNIQIAVGQIDKMVLMPGQEVSMNEVFLPRTRANGYKEAGAYMNGRTVPAIGGGICQASSTIYNAAMNSGLTVTERHAHSMSVSYLPLGMDAAISSGSKDLKLRNDYPFPVLFEGSVEGKNLTVNVYTNEPLTAGVEYRFHAVRTGSLSARSYLEISVNHAVIEDRLVASSRYNPHRPAQTENED